MSLIANFSYPTAIRFGAGRISELADTCLAVGITKPLLVTDRGLAGLEMTANALAQLERAGLGRALFADVDPNSNEHHLNAGIAAFRRGGSLSVIGYHNLTRPKSYHLKTVTQ